MLRIWQINDAISLGLLDLERYAALKSIGPRRLQEAAGKHFLLDNMLQQTGVETGYTPQGKPYLLNRPGHISISHSHGRLAAIFNRDESTGIDIELVRDKVKQVEHKFLNSNESAMAAGHTGNLISFWAAKEALYKLYGLKEIDFRKNLHIETFNGGEMLGRVQTAGFSKRYRLACEAHGEYNMVYVVNEI